MTNSINRVVLVGFLGKDPEIRATTSGSKIANFSLATTESWKDKTSGEWQNKTDWHNIVIYNPGLVTLCEKYLHKGSKIYLEGSLQTRKWTDKSGKDQYTTEIVLKAFNGEIVLLDKQEKSETWEKVEEDSKCIPF
ncbi:MAG: Single-stranded DNA-binding protein [Alphaproteobacteria bacterium ADurb.Bin438]|nr:MAG: Single-stranded DNA-binding protein [Alphaproteobacteria bacterium ADurb.Bin438]